MAPCFSQRTLVTCRPSPVLAASDLTAGPLLSLCHGTLSNPPRCCSHNFVLPPPFPVHPRVLAHHTQHPILITNILMGPLTALKCNSQILKNTDSTVSKIINGSPAMRRRKSFIMKCVHKYESAHASGPRMAPGATSCSHLDTGVSQQADSPTHEWGVSHVTTTSSMNFQMLNNS